MWAQHFHTLLLVRLILPCSDIKRQQLSSQNEINLCSKWGAYKLSFSCSKRMTSYFLQNNHKKLEVQKVFVSPVQKAIQYARDHRKPICIWWLDIANVFGSVSHNLVQFYFRWYHVPLRVRKLISRITREFLLPLMIQPGRAICTAGLKVGLKDALHPP